MKTPDPFPGFLAVYDRLAEIGKRVRLDSTREQKAADSTSSDRDAESAAQPPDPKESDE